MKTSTATQADVTTRATSIVRAEHRRATSCFKGRGYHRPSSSPTQLPYRLSDHALLRLRERTSLQPEEVVTLLEDGAYERLARRTHKAHLYQNPAWIGLSFDELRQRGVNLSDYCYKHALLWSEPDQKAITLIIAVKDRTVVTVLDAENQDNGTDWSDKVTEEAIERARAKQAVSRIPSGLRVRVHPRVTWLTPNNELCGKKISGPHLTLSDLPLSGLTLSALANSAMSVVTSGHDIRLQLVTKTNGACLEAEYKLEHDHNGEISIQLVET